MDFVELDSVSCGLQCPKRFFLFFCKAQEITDAVDLHQMNPNEKSPYRIVAKCDSHLMNYPISFFRFLWIYTLMAL